MLTRIEGLPDHIIGIEATGSLTADDYKTVLEPALESAAASGRTLRILAVLGPDFEGFKRGGALEDMRTGLAHWSSWDRFAIVTDEGWIDRAVHWLGWLMPGEIRAFPLQERPAAERWVQSSDASDQG